MVKGRCPLPTVALFLWGMAAYLAALTGVRLTARRTATFMLQVVLARRSRDVEHRLRCFLDVQTRSPVHSVVEMRHRLAITSAHCIPYHPIRADGFDDGNRGETPTERPITPSNSNRRP